MLSFYLPFIKKIISLGKKIVLVIAVYTIIMILFAHFMKQDKPKLTSDPIQDNRKEIYRVINDPETNKTTEGKMTIATYRIMMCGIIGEGCTNNPDDGNKNFNNSVFGLVTKMILLPFQNPPASGIMWAMNGLQNAGFIPKTYAAQGIGFGTIQPFSKIWVAFRDLAYIFLVLVIITIGFMVMFRMKLNPQTVIGVENALPRIVISLILITFSFAIAGFLIDLMYLSIVVIIAILQPASVTATNPTGYNITAYQQKYIMAGPLEIYQGVAKNDWGGFFTIFFDLPNRLLNLVPAVGIAIHTLATFFGIFFLFPWMYHWGIFSPIKSLFEKLVPAQLSMELVVGGRLDLQVLWEVITKLPLAGIFLLATFSIVSSILLPLFIGTIIFFTLLFVFFRIFFLLLTTYAKILISVIISPILLLFEAIPGQSAFTNWLKGLIAELITFPVIVAIFILGTMIVNQSATGTMIQFPFLVGIDAKSFSYIIGMALLFMTPDLVKAVKQFIVPKPGLLDSIGTGAGVFFGGATTGLSTGIGEISKYGSLAYYFKPLQPILARFGLDKVLNTGGGSGGGGRPPPPGH